MKIHFIGCLGASMSALGELSRALGDEVTGSDSRLCGHDPANVIDKDLVVYTNAVKPDNCELSYARKLGIPTVERARFLADISKRFSSVVAVAGCHGKSTTTAMAGYAFSLLSPTVHVGADGASKPGGKAVFVTEACEYNRSFLELAPDIAIVLNTAFDHPDCYKTHGELMSAYRKFLSRAKISIVSGDENKLKGSYTFGLKESNYFSARDISVNNGRRSFDLYINGAKAARVCLAVPGAHNVYNALAALAAAHLCGVPISSAVDGIERFTGISRRFEYKGRYLNMAVYIDYAHHPDEIAAVISAAHELYPRVAVVYQPHTYSRTKALYKETAAALATADTVILTPIYAAREKPIEGVSSLLIADELYKTGKGAEYFCSPAEAASAIKEGCADAILFLGAGDIYKGADMLIN